MPRKPEEAWPSLQQIQSVDHAVFVSNTTGSPILLKNGEQLCQLRQILPVESSTLPPPTCGTVPPSPATCKPFSPRGILYPDGCLHQDTRDKFIALNLELDDVFNPTSLNTMVQVEKLRLLSTLAPPFLLRAKVGSHSTIGSHSKIGTPLRSYKTSSMSSKLPASSRGPSKSMSMWST